VLPHAALAALILLTSVPVHGAPESFEIDPNHTHPSFEADHLNGLSVWRGLFRKTSGTITLDRAANTGTIDVTVDMTSVDFGHDRLNETAVHSSAPPIFEADKYPVAHYTGTLGGFIRGVPTTVTGDLTLHGVTRPVPLRIRTFRCIANHPVLKKEVCGADVEGRLNRADFGITVGRPYGFRMAVRLRIQVEAIRTG